MATASSRTEARNHNHDHNHNRNYNYNASKQRAGEPKRRPWYPLFRDGSGISGKKCPCSTMAGLKTGMQESKELYPSAL